MEKLDTAGLTKKALQIRQDVLNMCCGAGTGHVTSSFSSIEILVALYYGGILRYDVANPGWPDRDRFIMSKGQASVLLYPILADLGYFPKEDTERFCQADGKFGVHLQHDVPGAEITSGSLGMGFGLATGMALAAQKDRKLHLVFSLLGDGECYEGSIWEAAMFAGHNRLNNLVAVIDRNYLCVTNFTENMLSLEPFEDKWRSFGWNVKAINGHSFDEIFGALEGVRSRKSSRPLAIIADTVKGKGISFMCYNPLWHGIPPSGDEAVCACSELQAKEVTS
ncbi:Transketolase, N-terminal section (EC [Olavius algarvensis associated proteobacterium Delta 3]|nr:Transketolase, N-terminal section (EC [Olavius algarvensis associated proteobacterium Delta 3]CAB5139614.1 Transketolase, N-terminal section (EC [Olavius algarvensis associated proteobacterium Delta 3]